MRAAATLSLLAALAAALLLWATGGPDRLESRGHDGLTRLQRAVRQDRLDRVEQLLAQGAHPDSALPDPLQGLRSSYGMSAHSSRNLADSPLVIAASESKPEILRALLEAGADPIPHGLPAAIGAGCHECAIVLLDAGAPVRYGGGGVLYPVNLLAERGDAELAQILIERGARLEAENADGLRALHLALRRCDPEGAAVVDVLLEAGADPNLRDHSLGLTPLDWARWHCNDAALEERLRAAGAWQHQGQHARLTVAVFWNDVGEARAALGAGANPSSLLPNGDSLLRMARTEGHWRLINLLAQAKSPTTP